MAAAPTTRRIRREVRSCDLPLVSPWIGLPLNCDRSLREWQPPRGLFLLARRTGKGCGVCAMRSRVSKESLALPAAGGAAFVPPDYFRRLEKREIFDGDRPLEVDLGCGDGTFLLEMAGHFPERDFLGVERLLGRVRKVCKRAGKAGLQNVKVLRYQINLEARGP